MLSRSSKAGMTAARHARSLLRECRRLCLVHTGVAASPIASVIDAGAGALPGRAHSSFWPTARNTARQSARASDTELNRMRVLDCAHVRESETP
jgi:hypothetical protein